MIRTSADFIQVRGAEASSGPIYVFMAGLFIVTALASFVPTSFALVSRVYTGEQALPPFVVHFHAASMSLWLLLLLAQSMLAYADRLDMHRKLGLISLVLAPCLLVSMLGMDLYGRDTFNVETEVVSSGVIPPDANAQLRQYVAAILLIHGASYLLFPTFFSWAILVRRKDNETHRRLMILATLVLLIPGLGRLLSITRVLPDFGLTLIDARHFYLSLLIVPALVYEVVKTRKLHRSYIVGVGLLVAWMVAAHFLWGSAWWLERGPRLLGVA